MDALSAALYPEHARLIRTRYDLRKKGQVYRCRGCGERILDDLRGSYCGRCRDKISRTPRLARP
jgi:rubrerythrin